MTDHDPLNDLASAHLDGATTPEEAARVTADPELLARVEVLRAVRMAVASPLPVDPGRREQAIAAALAAYDADVAPDTETEPATVAPVRQLTPVAARRTGASRSWRIAGVAAAVAAVVVLVPLIASLSSEPGDDPDIAATALEETARDLGDTSADSTRSGGEAFEPESTPTSTTLARRAAKSLGDFEDADGLAAAARSTATSSLTTGGYVAPAAVADMAGCLDELLAALPPDAIVLLTAAASLDGTAVDVVVTEDEVRIAGGDCVDIRVRPR